MRHEGGRQGRIDTQVGGQGRFETQGGGQKRLEIRGGRQGRLNTQGGGQRRFETQGGGQKRLEIQGGRGGTWLSQKNTSLLRNHGEIKDTKSLFDLPLASFLPSLPHVLHKIYTTLPLQCAYGMFMMYSSPNLNSVKVADPSKMAEDELPSNKTQCTDSISSQNNKPGN